MADTQVLGTCAARRVGSSPTSGITQWRLIYKQRISSQRYCALTRRTLTLSERPARDGAKRLLRGFLN